MHNVAHPRVFISYSRRDSECALAIASELSNQDSILVWQDSLDITPGQHWDMAVDAALYTCSHLVLLHTSSSVVSRHVWDEWAFALNHNKIVIPLLFESPQNVRLPYRLEQLQHINFYSQSFDQSMKDLISAIYNSPLTPDPISGAWTEWSSKKQQQLFDLLQEIKRDKSNFEDFAPYLFQLSKLIMIDGLTVDGVNDYLELRTLIDDNYGLSSYRIAPSDDYLAASRQGFPNGNIRNSDVSSSSIPLLQTIEDFVEEIFSSQEANDVSYLAKRDAGISSRYWKKMEVTRSKVKSSFYFGQDLQQYLNRYDWPN